MKQLEVYFDYHCPHCYKGHQNLKQLLPHHPDVQILWQPCEAHPRPEVRDLYTDVATMGMYCVRDCGGDVDRYNDLVYEAHVQKKQRSDDPDVLTAIALTCGADEKTFRAALTDKGYADEVYQANIRAWMTHGWEAVPSYICEGKKIGSRGGVAVPLEDLDQFLGGC